MKQMTLRLMIMLGMIAFGITLAIIIGQRLTTEAMAVLMGVVAGVVASIPTSLIVVWIAMQTMVKRDPEPRPEPRVEPPRPEAPRVIVMQQPQPVPAQAYGYPLHPGWSASSYPAMPAPRKFTVIGGAAEPEELAARPLESDL